MQAATFAGAAATCLCWLVLATSKPVGPTPGLCNAELCQRPLTCTPKSDSLKTGPSRSSLSFLAPRLRNTCTVPRVLATPALRGAQQTYAFHPTLVLTPVVHPTVLLSSCCMCLLRKLPGQLVGTVASKACHSDALMQVGLSSAAGWTQPWAQVPCQDSMRCQHHGTHGVLCSLCPPDQCKVDQSHQLQQTISTCASHSKYNLHSFYGEYANTLLPVHLLSC